MFTRRGSLLLGIVVLAAGFATANDASPDTTYVLGGPDRWDGRFETADGQPDWHGWTHADMYGGNTESHWHVSNHLPLAGQYSLWCGTWFENDCADGYGNGWQDSAVFRRAAADPDTPTTVRWQATARVDSEPGYDYFHVQVRRGTQFIDLIGPVDGVADLTIDVAVTLAPEDYFEGAWEIRFFTISDGAWSDEDCLWDSHGFARVDDVTVTVDGEVVSVEDFESGESGDWDTAHLPLVGDFTQLWSGLDDLDTDPAHQNDSWQVAFVDNGQVVPGTGGTPCGEWCYGPDGWVYNVTAGIDGNGVEGGAIGWANGGVWNAILSPILPWPKDADGGQFAFDVYAHMFYFSCGVTSYGWSVRATDAVDPDDIAMADWAQTRWSYYNPEAMPAGPGYFRIAADLAPLLPAETRWIQVRLEAFEGGPWCWGPYVYDASPAPYFDNAAIRAWRTVTDAPEVALALSLTAAPNPFNPRVTIRWSQPAAGNVEISIFDARGRLVRRLISATRPAGAGDVVWDGRDGGGRAVSGGIYLARLQTTTGSQRLKLSLVR